MKNNIIYVDFRVSTKHKGILNNNLLKKIKKLFSTSTEERENKLQVLNFKHIL